ncbi:hypothetical protein FACS1894199_13560 [Bacteroidia bacterium]|nr:hypothetical protein FACS1894199_13560 [Bacteroidia bacterium]
MHNIFYSRHDFVKGNSAQYCLSIRFATDGLSFCIHDQLEKLFVFSFQPLTHHSQDEAIATVKKAVAEFELLNLEYKKVIVIPCRKDKILIPELLFDEENLSEMYGICVPIEKNDVLLYHKIEPWETYLVEALPRSFVTFLTSRYQSVNIVNSAYPFIESSLSSTSLRTYYLFLDIHATYFDMLVTKKNHLVFFNSFTYNSPNDVIYYILSTLKKVDVELDILRTTISGDIDDDSKLLQSLSMYIPEITLVKNFNFAQTIGNEEVNTSYFAHLLSAHRCL